MYLPVLYGVTSHALVWWPHQWKYFQRYWLFVRGIHRSPVNSPHKGHAVKWSFDMRLNKKGWCQLIRGHVWYPTDSPIATRQGLCSGLLLSRSPCSDDDDISVSNCKLWVGVDESYIPYTLLQWCETCLFPSVILNKHSNEKHIPTNWCCLSLKTTSLMSQQHWTGRPRVFSVHVCPEGTEKAVSTNMYRVNCKRVTFNEDDANSHNNTVQYITTLFSVCKIKR